MPCKWLIIVCFFLGLTLNLPAQKQVISEDSNLILLITKRESANSILSGLNKASNNKDSIHALIKLSLHGGYSLEEGRGFAVSAFNRSKQTGYALGVGLSYIAFTATSINTEEVDSCLAHATAIFEKKHYKDLTLLAKLYASYTLTNQGEHYVRAFGLINEFLTQYTLHTDSSSYAMAWNLLGEIYRFVKNNTKALESYRKAFAYATFNKEVAYPAPMINIGTMHKILGGYDSSIFYYRRALYFDSTRTGSLTAYVTNRMAQVFILQGKLDLAKAHAKISRDLYNNLNNGQGIVLSASTQSVIHFKEKALNESVRFGEEAVNTALQINYYPEEAQDACKQLALTFEQLGNLKQALFYRKVYAEIRDKVYSPDVNLEMFNEQLKLETVNRELERKLITEKQLRSEHEAQEQRTLNLIVMAVLVLSIGVSIALFRKNNTIQNLNQDLSEKNSEILAQAEELKATNDEIEAINENLENLVKERSQKVIEQNQKLTEYAFFNAHKVRGPLARILGLINIFELELKNASLLSYSEMLKKAGTDLDASIKEITTILEENKSAESKSVD
jgi:tetratricopeptide (TPR) repeat protein